MRVCTRCPAPGCHCRWISSLETWNSLLEWAGNTGFARLFFGASMQACKRADRQARRQAARRATNTQQQLANKPASEPVANQPQQANHLINFHALQAHSPTAASARDASAAAVPPEIRARGSARADGGRTTQDGRTIGSQDGLEYDRGLSYERATDDSGLDDDGSTAASRFRISSTSSPRPQVKKMPRPRKPFSLYARLREDHFRQWS